ncbi:MAG: phasin family protein, partial [Gammaproteobacteria bacterium]|nr:phasin family protein [Gammaproteobacteria bacterium]
MNNTTKKAFETAEKIGNQSVDSLRQLGELQMNTWNNVIDQQLAIFNAIINTTSKQSELYTGTKNVEEIVRKQTELNRSLTEEIMGKTRESIEMAQNTGEEYR